MLSDAWGLGLERLEGGGGDLGRGTLSRLFELNEPLGEMFPLALALAAWGKEAR